MSRATVLIGSLLAAGAAAAVWPELRAYRRLAAITQSLRADRVPSDLPSDAPAK